MRHKDISTLDLREELLREHSRRNTTFLTNWIGNDKVRFGELMRLFLANEYRVTQRAAWVMSECAEIYPELVEPYMEKLVNNLEQQPIHDAVKRNTLRLFQHIDLPTALMGSMANLAFGFLNDPEEPIAIRVFAMSVLAKIARKEPDLKKELRLIIEEQLPYEGPAYRSRAKRELGKL